MARRRLPTVEQIADRQDTDQVERRNGRLYLVDTLGSYAPVRILDEEGIDSPEKQAQYIAQVDKMMSTARTRWHIRLLSTYAGMSEEARRFRIETLVRRDKALWTEKYGSGTMFAVPDQNDVSWSLQQEIETLKASS